MLLGAPRSYASSNIGHTPSQPTVTNPVLAFPTDHNSQNVPAQSPFDAARNQGGPVYSMNQIPPHSRLQPNLPAYSVHMANSNESTIADPHQTNTRNSPNGIEIPQLENHLFLPINNNVHQQHGGIQPFPGNLNTSILPPTTLPDFLSVNTHISRNTQSARSQTSTIPTNSGNTTHSSLQNPNK